LRETVKEARGKKNHLRVKKGVGQVPLCKPVQGLADDFRQRRRPKSITGGPDREQGWKKQARLTEWGKDERGARSGGAHALCFFTGRV